MEETASRPTVLELFAGCGGMMLGFHRAGFRTVLANEWDADACSTIRRNLTDRVAQCAIEEIETFPTADVVAGGPPCQGFSNLGERVPHDPRRQMWRHFFRAVEQAAPRIFVMENVPPLLKSQEYVEILKLATTLGYRTLGGVLDAADYGAPQRRKRAILVGVRDGEPFQPTPTHCDPREPRGARRRKIAVANGARRDRRFARRTDRPRLARRPQSHGLVDAAVSHDPGRRQSLEPTARAHACVLDQKDQRRQRPIRSSLVGSTVRDDPHGVL
ncbi:MAG: DNA cytosine methyltransferase [Pirellulales bacterium]